MIKKTLQKYQKHDAALGLSRNLLCYKDHAKDIYRGLTPESDITDASDTSAGIPRQEAIQNNTEPARQDSINIAAPTTEQSATLVSRVPATMNAITEVVLNSTILDAPVTAKDIIVATIAHKLNKSVADIDTSKSIKQLASGE